MDVVVLGWIWIFLMKGVKLTFLFGCRYCRVYCTMVSIWLCFTTSVQFYWLCLSCIYFDKSNRITQQGWRHQMVNILGCFCCIFLNRVLCWYYCWMVPNLLVIEGNFSHHFFLTTQNSHCKSEYLILVPNFYYVF